MSQLVFDGMAHTLTLLAADGSVAGGPWKANNVVDRKATLRFVPNRTYAIDDTRHPLKHGRATDRKGVIEDSTNGSFGPYGIIRLCPFKVDGVQHAGVGIHSGRHNQGAQDHATMGCIRTTDVAMAVITKFMATDHLMTIVVKNNHDQHNRQPKHRGDHHQSPHSSNPEKYLMI